MCCLTFEDETYRNLKKSFPKIGKIVQTANGEGKVVRHNVICNRISLRQSNGVEIETGLDTIIKETN